MIYSNLKIKIYNKIKMFRALNKPKKKLCPKLEKKVNIKPNRIILKFKLLSINEW